MTRPRLFPLAFALLALWPGAAWGYELRFPAQCGPWAEMRALLADRHGELEVAGGPLNGGGGMMLRTENKETGVWSFVVRMGEEACLIATGTDWRALPPRPPDGPGA